MTLSRSCNVGRGHRDQWEVPPHRGLADDLDAGIVATIDLLQQAGQSPGRVRGLVGDPDGVMLRADPDRGLLGMVVPRDLGDRPPVFAVVAGDREDAGPHRAGPGLPLYSPTKSVRVRVRSRSLAPSIRK